MDGELDYLSGSRGCTCVALYPRTGREGCTKTSVYKYGGASFALGYWSGWAKVEGPMRPAHDACATTVSMSGSIVWGLKEPAWCLPSYGISVVSGVLYVQARMQPSCLAPAMLYSSKYHPVQSFCFTRGAGEMQAPGCPATGTGYWVAAPPGLYGCCPLHIQTEARHSSTWVQ